MQKKHGIAVLFFANKLSKRHHQMRNVLTKPSPSGKVSPNGDG